MSSTPFVHLRAHTEYSVVESTLRIDQLIAQAKASGQPAVAMTDVDGLFGAVRFYSKAREAGLKPIIGVDIAVDFSDRSAPISTEGEPSADSVPAAPQPPRRLVLLAENHEGYLKMMRLISKAYTKNLRDGKPVLLADWLADEGSSGLFCLTGTDSGVIGAPVLQNQNMDLARSNVARLHSIFSDRLFIEVQRRGAPTDPIFVQAAVDLAQEFQLPVLATHPMQFLKQDDYVAHELKVCGQRKQFLLDRNRERSFTPYQHFESSEQMSEIFSDLPIALANASLLAQRCNLEIPLGKGVLPDFPTPSGQSLDDFFAQKSRQGLEERLIKLFPDPVERTQKRPAYDARLAMEIEVIQKMGFPGYFMIVHDFIDWAKEHDIPVGPGRGSGAGSLVAYALKITDLDPLEYNLLFERFLNPERVSMPDFDIDFCMDRRELVIDYVTRKYGSDAVSGIAALQTLKARAAVKAAGRVLNMPVQQVEGVSKLIPSNPGQEITIKDALENEDALRERYESEPEVAKLIDHALTLEDLPNAIGQHAAGVVIARGKITDFAPLYIPEGKTQPVTQYDKDDVEKAGLVKFDFLGLKTLTELDYATKIIRERLGHSDFDLSTIPLADPEVYKLFQQGDTHSIFQFESAGMQNLLKKARPEVFADLVALNALYRPGPMDLIDDYVNRKNGIQQVAYLDERLKPILSETYGIMVYQEQVMQIAQVIGGYSLGGADLLRRAMGKKKPEEMAKHRAIFVEGASKKGVDADSAGKLYDMMEKFAGYGFNKSHAAAYSLLAYQTAYLKKHYPSAFFASWLSVESEADTESVPALIKDAKKHGVTVFPPNINTSEASFTVDPSAPEGLIYGLAGLKGLGKDAANHIVQTRKQKGEFTSLSDFLQKVGKGFINKRTIETLIKSGAFDSLHPNRNESLAAVPALQKYMTKLAEQNPVEASPIGELFSLAPAPSAADGETAAPKKKRKKTAAPPEAPEWPTLPEQPLMEKLVGENEAFGFYFSGHPFAFYRSELGGLKSCVSLDTVLRAQPNRFNQHMTAAVVSDLRAINTSKGGKMLIATISDGEKDMEIKAFTEVYAGVQSWLKKDAFVLLSLQVNEDKFRGGNSFIASDIRSFEDAKLLLADTLHVALPPERLPDLQKSVTPVPGSTPVVVWHPAGDTYVRATGTNLTVDLSHDLINTLQQEFGSKHVKLKFRQTPPASSNSYKSRGNRSRA